MRIDVIKAQQAADISQLSLFHAQNMKMVIDPGHSGLIKGCCVASSGSGGYKSVEIF